MTDSPGKSAAQLGGDDLRQVPVSLDKSFVQVTGGLIWRLEQAELQISYRRILAGRNIPALNVGSMGVVFEVPNVTGRADNDGGGDHDEDSGQSE